MLPMYDSQGASVKMRLWFMHTTRDISMGIKDCLGNLVEGRNGAEVITANVGGDLEAEFFQQSIELIELFVNRNDFVAVD